MINILLWVTPSFWMFVYYLVLEILKDLSYNYHSTYVNTPYYPTIQFLKDYLVPINYFNILFVIVVMAYFTRVIRKWRGIAEE